MDNSEQPSRPSGERHGRMRHDTSVPPDAIGYAQANVRHAHHRPDQASRYENASQDARQPVIDVVPVEASRQSEQASRHARVAGAGGSAGFGSARTAHASHGRMEEPAGRVTADGERVVRVRKKKKNRRGLKIALITLAVIVALLLAAGVAVALYFNSLNNAISYEEATAGNRAGDPGAERTVLRIGAWFRCARGRCRFSLRCHHTREDRTELFLVGHHAG